ncbi:MAG: type II toxin-antitoxin system VapC family toxin [Acidobacteria bacterium]|nr:type II toxin-antitoxin system VapC family toxin [Acidobacteriota bacterium]
MILIDTTPLVALCDGRDSKHRAALRHLALLAREELATCDAVLTEACFLLPHRSQRLRLRAMLQELNIQPLPVTNERGFWFEVLDWLAKYADHEPDWADGCLAVLSGRDRGLKIWTYDREFRTTWRRPNGTAIPLAVRSL